MSRRRLIVESPSLGDSPFIGLPLYPQGVLEDFFHKLAAFAAGRS